VPTLQSTEIKGGGRNKAIVNDILAMQIVRPHGNNCDLSFGPNFARREELPNRKMRWTACDPRNPTPRVSKASGVPSLSRAPACSPQTFTW
jgi:hypothetical protein